MLTYSIKNNVFIDNSEEINEDAYIILSYCGLSNEFVLTLIEDNVVLCLHNENQNLTSKANELFKVKNASFKNYLDFFNQQKN